MARNSEDAVRNYLKALRDPGSLRDENRIAELQQELDSSDDTIDRLRLQQELLEAANPPLEAYEDSFVEHAKAWADRAGITANAFLAEGVSSGVLRRAGFSVRGAGRRTARAGGRPRKSPRAAGRTRTSAEEVRKAIPKGTFTVKDVQEASGASPAVVRRVIAEAVAAGEVDDLGPDPDHSGPGRSPTLYQKG